MARPVKSRAFSLFKNQRATTRFIRFLSLATHQGRMEQRADDRRVERTKTLLLEAEHEAFQQLVCKAFDLFSACSSPSLRAFHTFIASEWPVAAVRQILRLSPIPMRYCKPSD